MHLGTLLTHLQDEVDAASALDALGDMVLFTRVGQAARRFEETPGEYVSASAQRFAAQAGDADWLALMTAIERAPNPAQAVLVRIVTWALDRDAAATTHAAPGSRDGGCGRDGCGCAGGTA